MAAVAGPLGIIVSTSTRRKWITRTSVAVVGLGFGAGLFWLFSSYSQTQVPLHISRAGDVNGYESLPVIAAEPNRVVPDDLRQKYAPPGRAEFHVTCSQDTSIFVLATGVQIEGTSGWKIWAEDYRGEIWRLKTGIPREVCVERPASETWRAYIRYGTEMKGPSLLRAQLREAWSLRSFSNWTGKAWGGGRWSGVYELFSEEAT